MQLQILAADALPPQQLHAVFRSAFADYLIGPFELSPDQWPGFIARQCIDLKLSRVALRGDEVLAFALVAPRSRSGRWRLGTMGAVPAARGTGAAPALLDEMIERARLSGVFEIELEVFAQNERAVRLYRSRGFELLHELFGYQGIAPTVAAALPSAGGSQVDLDAAFDWLDKAVAEIGDVPLQVTPASLSSTAAVLQAWRLGTAQLISREGSDGQPVVVHSLLDRDPQQRDARTLIDALMARHPGRAIKVPALQRRDLGGDALREAGMLAAPLNQQLLLLRTASPGTGRADSTAATSRA